MDPRYESQRQPDVLSLDRRERGQSISGCSIAAGAKRDILADDDLSRLVV